MEDIFVLYDAKEIEFEKKFKNSDRPLSQKKQGSSTFCDGNLTS